MEDDPEDPYLKARVQQFEKAIEDAAPKVAVQTSDLQRQLELLQQNIVTDEKAIDDKKAFARKKWEEIDKTCLKIGIRILDNEGKIEELKAELIIRSRAVLPAEPSPPPAPAPTVEKESMGVLHLPAFVSSFASTEVKWIEQNLEKFGDEDKACATAVLESFPDFTRICKLLCNAQAQFSAAQDRGNSLNSTNMAPEPEAGAAATQGSPERVPSSNEEPGFGYGPTVLFGPAAATLQPAADVHVQLLVPDDGGLDGDDDDGGAAQDSAQSKAAANTAAADRASVMAMARVSRAQGALQAQMEIDAA